jgi:fructokinase
MYLVCGEALFDVFVDPSTRDDHRQVTLFAKAGGSPHNVAIGLARLGCPVALATQIATDTLGRRLEQRLQTEGVDCRFLRRTATATPIAMVDVHESGIARYTFYGLDRLLYHPELSAVQREWTSIIGVHVGSIPIVSEQSAGQLLQLVASAPAKTLVSFDPNVRLSLEPDVARWHQAVDSFRQYAHVIKVGEDDLAQLYGDRVDVEEVAARWLAHRCSLVVVTRGARGAMLFSKSCGMVSIAAMPVVVADTVGAGDSFQAAMLAWFVEKGCTSPAQVSSLTADGMEALGRFATRAASTTCRYRGPEFPYRKALD